MDERARLLKKGLTPQYRDAQIAAVAGDALPLPARPARANLRAVIQVNLTRHLFSHFPQLEGQLLEVEAADVAGVVRALEARAPGIGFYLCDERGRLRPHVNVFIGNAMIRDRRHLSDTVSAGDKVSILQALSGG